MNPELWAWIASKLGGSSTPVTPAPATDPASHIEDLARLVKPAPTDALLGQPAIPEQSAVGPSTTPRSAPAPWVAPAPSWENMPGNALAARMMADLHRIPVVSGVMDTGRQAALLAAGHPEGSKLALAGDIAGNVFDAATLGVGSEASAPARAVAERMSMKGIPADIAHDVLVARAQGLVGDAELHGEAALAHSNGVTDHVMTDRQYVSKARSGNSGLANPEMAETFQRIHATAAGNPDVLALAESMRTRAPMPRVKAVDPVRGAEMAKVYEGLPKNDPAAKPAYDALNREVAKQYQAIQDAGYKFEFTPDDPYKGSKDMMADVRDNKRLKVFATPEGSFHPYMTPEQNNQFRAVHDFLAHAGPGNQFGPAGEENAFRLHAATLSNDALPALAAETRGQNSWVNFGPNANLPVAERPFAEQKAALWPMEYLGDYGDMPVPRERRASSRVLPANYADRYLGEPNTPRLDRILTAGKPEPERVVSAASKYGEDVTPEPYHGAHAPDLSKYDSETEAGNITQGFVTNRGRFLDREEALDFAKKNGQVPAEATGYDGKPGQLHSSALNTPEPPYIPKGVVPPATVADLSAGDQRIPEKLAGKGVKAGAQDIRMEHARRFLAESPTLTPDPTPLKFLDQNLIKPDAGPTMAPLPERAPVGTRQRVGHLLDVDTPANRDLAERMALRGKAVGETWYPSYEAVSDFVKRWGGNPDTFRQATSAASIRNTVPAELHAGSTLYGALQSGVISKDELAAARALPGEQRMKAFGTIAEKARTWAKSVTPGGSSPALMGAHVDAFERFVNGTPFDSHKVPMFEAHKGGDAPGMVIDSHAVRQHSFGSRFGPLYNDTPNKLGEYGYFESLMRRNARDLGMSDRGYQASTWTGGGLLSGLQTDPTKNFAQLFEDALTKNATARNVAPERLAEDLAGGRTVLKDMSRQGSKKVKRVK